MKFTLSWLKDHLDTEATPGEVADRLTAIGLEVESMDDPAEVLAPFTIAHVVTAEKHPNADKLRVCTVDVGNGEPIRVVCGAPNARAGMKGVFAAAGTYVPGLDVTLKSGVIRGEPSEGMLCSESELQLSDNHDGIIELPEDAPVGESYANWAKLGDVVIEINLTPNRGDCAGVRGIARDLAAAGLGTLKPNREKYQGGSGNCSLKVSIETEAALCPAFAYRLIRDVNNIPSPDWVQRRLRAIGQRPISALVDITNLMTLDQCRPMHVFDLAKLQGNLTIRAALEGERLLALNGKELSLEPGMVLIADEQGPISLAGIMGGETTGCTESTTDVLVESALWDPSNIARTGRRLDLHSDARFRFERGTDPAAVVDGMEIATQWIVEFCGGEPGKIDIAGKIPSAMQSETFRPSVVRALGGLDVPASDSLQILADLGFQAKSTKQDGEYLVAIPTWRSDIQSEADFVEEIVRIKGLDSIPSVSLDREHPLPVAAFSDVAQQKRRVRRALAAAGMMEAVTWSFLSSEVAALFGELNPLLFLENPMSAELNYMRSTLLSNLIAAAGRNADRGYPDVQLFEVGTVFLGVKAEEQPQRAAAVRAGMTGDRHWKSSGRPVDLFDAKRDALTALAAAGAPVDSLQVTSESSDYFHPGRSGGLALGRNVLANFGEIHPRLLRAMNVKEPIVAMEISFDSIPSKRQKSAARPLLALPQFHPIERDFAFIVDRDVSAASVLKAARTAEKKLVVAASLFDVYEGKGVPEGHKSLAISVTLQPLDKPLNDSDIEAVSQKIVAQVAKSTGGTLRA